MRLSAKCSKTIARTAEPCQNTAIKYNTIQYNGDFAASPQPPKNYSALWLHFFAHSAKLHKNAWKRLYDVHT